MRKREIQKAKISLVTKALYIHNNSYTISNRLGQSILTPLLQRQKLEMNKVSRSDAHCFEITTRETYMNCKNEIVRNNQISISA